MQNFTNLKAAVIGLSKQPNEITQAENTRCRTKQCDNEVGDHKRNGHPGEAGGRGELLDENRLR